MSEEIIGGIPVLISDRDRRPQTIHIKITKKIKDRTMKELPLRHRKALQKYMDQGMTNKKKAAVEAGFSETSATSTMNKILKRKPIIEALENRKVDDDFIAKKLKAGVDAKHPQFPKRKDYHASIKFLQEINKVADNLPATKIQQESRNIHIILTSEDHKQFQKFKEMRGESD